MGQLNATTSINMYQSNPRDMHWTTETMSGIISTRGFGGQRQLCSLRVRPFGHANLAFAHAVGLQATSIQ